MLTRSSDGYGELVELFAEFRESLKPTLVDGVPDFTPAAMAAHAQAHEELVVRLVALDHSGWSVEQLVDYHTVKAEMNAVAFDHRVLRPWARDPGFYNLTDGIYPRLLVHHSRSLSDWGLEEPEAPLSDAGVEDFRRRLRVVPPLLSQAEENLTEASGELADVAIRVKDKDVELLLRFRATIDEHHPQLLPDVDAALAATEGFRDWLLANRDRMITPGGIGRDNYTWWMNRVHLIPYSFGQIEAMAQADYDRAITFLKLAENRNRNEPAFHLTGSAEENTERQEEVITRLMSFLRDEELLTLPDDLEPLPRDQYPRVWGTSAYLRAGDRGFFEETNDREPTTNVAHVFFGHYYVDGRKIWYQADDERPIRGRLRVYDMHEARSEAIAFGIEEWLLQAGFFDDRPRAKEIAYIWLAFRAIRALADLKMHSGEYTLEEARRSIAEGIPHGWAEADSDAVWWDTEETLRAPGHSTNYVVGRNMIQGLMATRARQLGPDFTLRRFFDELLRGGIVPIALTHWELTGDDDLLRRLPDDRDR